MLGFHSKLSLLLTPINTHIQEKKEHQGRLACVSAILWYLSLAALSSLENVTPRTHHRSRLPKSVFLSTCDLKPGLGMSIPWQYVFGLNFKIKPSICFLFVNSTGPSTQSIPQLSDPGPEKLCISTRLDAIACVCTHTHTHTHSFPHPMSNET